MSIRARAWQEAARSLGVEPEHRSRPGPFRWLWYAFWGPLPERYRVWVLYDATCATWVLRHLARLVAVAALPVAAVAVFLPATLGIRLSTALLAGGGGLIFSAVWINEATEYRTERAGWRPELASELRQRRREVTKWLSTIRKL